MEMKDLQKQIQESNDKYDKVRREIEKTFEKYSLRPLEIYRVANELQARSFEMLIHALDKFVEDRIKEAIK